MHDPYHSRRDFMKRVGLGVAATAAVASSSSRSRAADEPRGALIVDPRPKYDLSPGLYMQFMEPLGTTDGSVSAGWDYMHDRWRPDLIDVTARLAPPIVRWGGALAGYYRWREGVGPRETRVPMHNLVWGGVEPNQVGTREFVDFCRAVGADPLMCVNFESDGRPGWARNEKGEIRSGDADEAADWVSYCNDPDHAERHRHGCPDSLTIRLWQIGNETSYLKDGWSIQTGAEKTIRFAKAMRKRDPDIKLIGWGDISWEDTRWDTNFWAPGMIELAGEYLDYIAFHHMFNPDAGEENSPLRDIEYRKDPAWTWERLMRARDVHEGRIRLMRELTDKYDIPLAMTECHFALPGRDRCEVLSTWAAGVANARLLNVHERHGDKLKIATAADFCGTRWQVNAVMIPVPAGQSYMMPVALVMCLYRHHTGEKAVDVVKAPDDLDVTASRTGDRVFLHVVNTNRTRSTTTELAVREMGIVAGRAFEMAGDPEYEVIETEPDRVQVVEKDVPADGRWTFPAASVTAVELDVQQT
jgi:alpha-N-arabinofuranosidase